MFRVSSAILALAILACAAFGQTQKLATATASQPFTLRGETVNPSGVPSWPVIAGDEVAAGAGPVTLTFPDGSKVALAPGSRGILDLIDGKAWFRLLSGEAAYDLKEAGSIQLTALDRLVQVSDLRGSYRVGRPRREGGFWTPRNIALVLGGAGAAAAGIGIAATRSPASVSPSQ